ncbi:transcriptional regulator, PadR family [Bacteriovorax sp. BSW11_IV]|uniref:PadR family transcriptional regulator n=1 Tax=Bacteriovorax sp. BSW11_IV TaxID=1353529 RepID=UPI000389FEAE|nr:PadR family transcriptional regulator [Bacteriovorax sp. BSW11_IV]EQC48904.1 transcriptional regulator, PadR family [Bacteriovorax sp. BSW11_IV]
MEFNKELIKGNLITIILSTLSEKEMYGYEIIKTLDDSSNGVFKMKEGTLYPLLHGLEFEGYIKSSERKSDNGRKRKYYKITKAGLKRLEDKKKEWTAFKEFVDQLVASGISYACQN